MWRYSIKMRVLIEKVRQKLQSISRTEFFNRFIRTTMSVSIAFAVDKLHKSYTATHQFEAALTAMQAQNRENAADIDSCIVGQRQFREIIWKVEYDTSITLMELASEPPYVMLPTLQTASLSRFINNPNIDIDFELLTVLANIEAAQKNIQELSSKTTDLLYSPNSNDTTQAGNLQKLLMINLQGAMIHSEGELKQKYLKLEEYLAKNGI